MRAKLKHRFVRPPAPVARLSSLSLACVSQCESTGQSTSPRAGLREVCTGYAQPRLRMFARRGGRRGGIVALERRKQRSSRRSVGPIVSEKGGSSTMQWASHGRQSGATTMNISAR